MSQSLLNTLYVTTDGAYLSKEQETVVVTVNRERRQQIPFLAIGSLVCFGRVTMSPELMGALAKQGIGVAFFGYNGRFLARVEGLPGGNVLVRRAQHRAADSAEMRLKVARSAVIGKVVNARRFLVHAARDAQHDGPREALSRVAEQLSIHLRGVERSEDLSELRGFEGVAAHDYFGVFNSLIKRTGIEFCMDGRSRRPPRDRINALLSFGYALLQSDCSGALAGVGLDPAVGFLHEDRPGRLGLALDLMEELRVPMVDRLVVALVNRAEIEPQHLIADAGGAWSLTETGRKIFLVAYQKAKQVSIHHPFLDQETTWGMVSHLQARLLARCIRGDLDAYPPFEIRA